MTTLVNLLNALDGEIATIPVHRHLRVIAMARDLLTDGKLRLQCPSDVHLVRAARMLADVARQTIRDSFDWQRNREDLFIEGRHNLMKWLDDPDGRFVARLVERERLNTSGPSSVTLEPDDS